MKRITKLIDLQIDELRNCGLVLSKLASGNRLLSLRSEEDFIHETSGEPREDLFSLVLYFLASEDLLADETVPVGSRGMHFDYECIYSDGDYVTLVKRIAFVAGEDSNVSDLRDWVDVPRNEVLLKFNFKRREHYFRPIVDRDWVDEATLTALMKLFTRKGYKFYRLHDSVVLYLKNSIARRINTFAPDIALEAA